MRLLPLSIVIYLGMAVESKRILGLFPLPRETHFLMFEKLMKGLVEKRHEVDVVSYFPQKTKIPRYTDIDLRKNASYQSHNLSVQVVENYGILETANYIFKEYGTDMCEKTLRNPLIINLAKSTTKYDLIITELFGSDCLLGFAYLYKIPVVGILGDALLPWAIDRMGNPDNPSYMPNYLLPYGSKMSLEDRVWNFISGFGYKVGYLFLSLIPSEMRARELFGPDLTPIDVLAFNTSLLLVNTHFSINFPRPMVPGIIEVAGMHIGTPKPLPNSLKKFTNNSKALIFVSLQVKPFSRNEINKFIDVLGNLPNPVIWKGFKGDLEGKIPDNFYVDDELENLDILCHANTRVMITNGDFFTLQEAIYCGVPIIGIPLIAEHEIYVRDFVQKGFAVQVRHVTLTENEISNAINIVLHNSTYKMNANKYSRLFRDRPIKPLDEAIYWVEYVMNHNGAKHLRTIGADLIWMEYYNIDVGLVFFLLILIMFAVMLTIYNFIVRSNFIMQYINRFIPMDTQKKEN